MKKVTYIVTLVIIALFLVQSMGLAQASEEIILPNNRMQGVNNAVELVPAIPPSIVVTKTTNPIQVTEPGGMVTFTVVILNTSPVGRSVVINSLVDNIHGDLNGQGTCLVPQSILPGASYTCEFQAMVSGNAGYVETDVVTASGADIYGNPVSDFDDATVTVTPLNPVIDVVKTANPVQVAEPGGIVMFTVVVLNQSNPTDPVTITSLSDSIHGNLNNQGTCSVPQTIQPGASYTCTFSAPVNGNAGYVETDVVTASGTDDENTPVSDFDDATVTVTDVLPTVDLVKDVTPATLPEPGGAFNYTLTIYNTSVEPVVVTILTDTNPLSAACTSLIGQTIAVGGSLSCSYSVTHTDEGTYPNTASVTVEDNEGNSASDSDNETVTVTDVLPTVDLVKDVTPSTLPEPGGAFNYTLTIYNTSVEPVVVTVLTDTNPLPAACTSLIGQTIAVGGSLSCSYSVTHTDEGTYPNTASVTVEDNEGNSASDSDNETVTVTDVLPTVDLVKDVTPSTLPEPGGAFNYTLTIYNTSVEPVVVTILTDTNPLPAACTSLIGQTIPVGGSLSCSYSVTHTDAGTYPNTASVTVEDNEGHPASDSDNETVTVTDVLPQILVEKTANPVQVTEPGGMVTFTVVIENNSSPADPVTITSLVDDIHGDLNGQGTCSVPQTIQPGASYTCLFSAMVSGNAGDSETDTVTATGTDDEENPVSDSDDAIVTVVVDDGLPEIDVQKTADPSIVKAPGGPVLFTVVVTNNSGPTDPVTITSLVDDIHGDLNGQGTCSVPQTIQPGASYTCQFTATVSGEAGDREIDTVTASGTDDEGNPVSDDDDATVEITDTGLYKIYLPNSENDQSIQSLVPMTVGYEDLDLNRDDMDFDYNDWVTRIDTRLSVDADNQNLYRINFIITPQARGGVRDHSFHILIPSNTFAGDGVATLTVKDQFGSIVSSMSNLFNASADNDFVVVSPTSDAFPLKGKVVNAFESQPYVPTQRTAELSIQFYTPGPFDQNYLSEERISIPHGDGLFFDPYLEVLGKNLEIHQGDLRLLSIPEISWMWPEERVRIDLAYPDVSGTQPDFVFPDNWWINHNTCVYGDGVTCSINLNYIPAE